MQVHFARGRTLGGIMMNHRLEKKLNSTIYLKMVF